MSATVTIRVDERTKAEASEVVEFFGFDLSSVTRAFYKQIARERRIPLSLEWPNDETVQALREAERLASDPASMTYEVEDALAELKK